MAYHDAHMAYRDVHMAYRDVHMAYRDVHVVYHYVHMAYHDTIEELVYFSWSHGPILIGISLSVFIGCVGSYCHCNCHN